MPTIDECRRTRLGLAVFAEYLPILLRIDLIILFLWYCIELFIHTTVAGARWFLGLSVGLLIGTFTLVMLRTYRRQAAGIERVGRSNLTPLWPFLLINMAMIIFVAAIGKRDSGLLGFTQQWVERIGTMLGVR